MPTFKYQVTNLLRKSEKSAISFRNKEKRYSIKFKQREELISKVGGINPLWNIISLVIIITSIGLAFIEGYMGKNAMAAVFDPMGTTEDTTFFMLFGGILSLLAMISGIGLHQGVVGEMNHIIGKREREFGLSFILGMILSISIIGFQYYLVQVAGDGANEFNSFAIIAILLPLMEILFGILFLEKAFTYLTIIFLGLLCWLLSKGMLKTARRTYVEYSDYNEMRNAWNRENTTEEPSMELEGNENIRRAITYYSSYSDIKINDNGSNLPQTVNNANNVPPPTDNSVTNNSSNQVDEPITEEGLDEFINNNDDDITF